VISVSLPHGQAAGRRDGLWWMLRAAFSPYRHHLDAVSAEAIVYGFFSWLHHDDGAVGGHRWSCWSVRPNFLYDTGYYSQQEPESAAAYFDGGRSDTATLRRTCITGTS
jgi:hypothetical protein